MSASPFATSLETEQAEVITQLRACADVLRDWGTLNSAQLDGFACISCGKPAFECGAMVPLFDGSVLFRCDPGCKEASA